METTYLICFVAGAAFAIFAAILGEVLSFHLGHMEIGGGHIPIVSPTTIASFVTIFGGMGLILDKATSLTGSIILLLSVLIAIIGAVFILFLVMVPLYKAQKNNAKSNQEMIGKFAEVSVAFSGKNQGEILYTEGTSRVNAVAESKSGEEFTVGEIVEVTNVIDSIFIVKKTGGNKHVE